jgi:hypothetical protein
MPRKTFILLTVASAVISPVHANSAEEAAKAWGEGRQADAVAIWQALGAKGDRDSLYNLGQSARTGRGMPKDSAKAVEFYRQALKLGHPKAGEVLGLMLFADESTMAEGLALLRDAAATGSPRANFAIAITDLPTTSGAKGLVTLRDRFKLALAGGIEAAREPLSRVEKELAQIEVRVAAPVITPTPAKPPVKIVDVGHNAPSIPSAKAWRISLGDYESNTVAMVKWMRISARQRLKAFPVFIEPEARKFRLSFGNFKERGEAQKLCTDLKTDKTSCIIIGGL